MTLSRTAWCFFWTRLESHSAGTFSRDFTICLSPQCGPSSRDLLAKKSPIFPGGGGRGYKLPVHKYNVPRWERSGSVVECLTRARGAAVRASRASLRCGPLARHIYPNLVLVQPRKTRPCLTERLLMGRKESNQTKANNVPRYHVLVIFIYRLLNSQSKKGLYFPNLWDFFPQPEDFIRFIPKFKRHRLYPKKGNKITVFEQAGLSLCHSTVSKSHVVAHMVICVLLMWTT